MTSLSKQELRKKLKPLRANITDVEYNQASEKLLNIDLHPLRIDQQTIVAGYFPIRSECNCLALLKKLHSQGVTIVLPLIHGDERPLTFKQWNPEDKLTQGQMNIPEPRQGALDIVPDILFLPLLAFDNKGWRLGYGKGHYDRTLADLKKEKKVVAVGIAYDFQEVGHIPHDKYDQPLDWILTPSGLQKFEQT